MQQALWEPELEKKLTEKSNWYKPKDGENEVDGGEKSQDPSPIWHPERGGGSSPKMEREKETLMTNPTKPRRRMISLE